MRDKSKDPGLQEDKPCVVIACNLCRVKHVQDSGDWCSAVPFATVKILFSSVQ